MYALRRKTARSVARLPAASTRTRRRYASGHEHGHEEPKSESLGMAVYIAIAAVPFSIGLYSISRKSSDGKIPALSSLIDKYSNYKENWTARNTLHTAMVEQAAFDRSLFHNSGGTAHVNLKFPEIFNTGSPYNVSAGQGARNMDELVAHYEKQNSVAEKKRDEASEEKKR